MERLTYIDVHEVDVRADVDAAWSAVVRAVPRSFGGYGWLTPVLGLRPGATAGAWAPDPEPGAAVPGFAVDDVRRGERLSLRGGHRFSHYRLDFEVVPAGAGRSWVRARTWADFPGPAGAAYRALVVGTGGHRVVVRRMLRGIAEAARRGVAGAAVGPSRP